LWIKVRSTAHRLQYVQLREMRRQLESMQAAFVKPEAEEE